MKIDRVYEGAKGGKAGVSESYYMAQELKKEFSKKEIPNPPIPPENKSY